MKKKLNDSFNEAIDLIKNSRYTSAFTGAGISVESGIPPFRGEDGLWSKYDSKYLDINYFTINPTESWEIIKKIFLDYFGKVKPNLAHYALAELERKNKLQSIITQNIDNLHQEAGSKVVYEYHGNAKGLVCMSCRKKFSFEQINLDQTPVKCSKCKGLLKPDFVFFGEGIPEFAARNSVEEAYKSDVFLLIGTSGEVMPANMVPALAKQNGAKIIEINTSSTNYTYSITDVFLEGSASSVMQKINDAL